MEHGAFIEPSRHYSKKMNHFIGTYTKFSPSKQKKLVTGLVRENTGLSNLPLLIMVGYLGAGIANIGYRFSKRNTANKVAKEKESELEKVELRDDVYQAQARLYNKKRKNKELEEQLAKLQKKAKEEEG